MNPVVRTRRPRKDLPQSDDSPHSTRIFPSNRTIWDDYGIKFAENGEITDVRACLWHFIPETNGASGNDIG